MMRPIARETAIALDTGELVDTARRVRELTAEDLEAFPASALERAASNFRAAAYSITSAARTFEHAARARRSTP